MIYHLELYCVIFAMNVLAFGLFGYDKHGAVCRSWRIPELVLLLATLFLGAFGSLCGMIVFHHKTRKPIFTAGVPVLLFLQVAALAYYFTHY